MVDCVKRREKLKRSAFRHANSLWKIVDETHDAPRTFEGPLIPPSSLTSLSPWSSSSDPKHLPSAVHEKPSTRGSSVRLSKARTDLTRSGTPQEGEHWGSSEEEQSDRKRGLEEASEVGTMVEPKRVGCAEQEQAWNALARLPARWTGYFDNGGLYQEESNSGEYQGVGSVGRMVTRGLKRRGKGEAVGGNRGNGTHGLFDLYPSRTERGGGTTGRNDVGQKLRAGVGRAGIPSYMAPGDKAVSQSKCKVMA